MNRDENTFSSVTSSSKAKELYLCTFIKVS